MSLCSTVRRSLAAAALAAVALAAPAAAITLDQLASEQWAVAPDAILNLRPAWEIAQGAGVTVAVVDSGILATHRDLAANVWVNADEKPGNRVDDDGNGYIDDVNGIDLTNADPNDQTPDDEDGHGTHVSGTIAGAKNGGGIVGVAFQSKVMAVKVLDGQGRGTTNAVAEGIRYATANGARVINMSLNGPTPSPPLTEAINAACAANVLVVVSAGNEGKDIDATPSYPVSIPSPCLIGVAATAPAGGGRDLAGISNFGRFTVAVAAPGQEVLSSAKDGDYEVRTGTSMASPHVAGVAALALSANPGLSAPDLRAKVIGSARKSPLPVTAGYLDALAAVKSAGGSASSGLGQAPRLSVVSAQVSGKPGRFTLQTQVSVTGSTDAVARYVVTAGRRPVATVRSKSASFSARARLKVAPKSLVVTAFSRAGKPIGRAAAKVKFVKTGPKDTGGDKALGRTAARSWSIR